jgi:hypothetical protein
MVGSMTREDVNVRTEFEWLRYLLYTMLTKQEKIMAAIDDANTNLAALQADVTALLAKPSGGVPEASVQAIADALATLDAQVKTALNA